jgi:COMPASS component SWD3
VGPKCIITLKQVNIWDLRVGEVVSTIVGPRIAGDSIDFREDVILTGASRVNEQLQLWDYRTKKNIHTFVWD